MSFGGKLMVGLALNAAFVAGVQARINAPAAAVSTGPYHAITDRNIFGLIHKDTNTTDAAPPLPPPNVNLVGLMQVSGRPQGVFAISEPGPGAKPAANYILGVEERQQGVDVLALDLTAKTAKIQVGENVSVIKLVEPKPVTSGPVGGSFATAGPAQGVLGGRAGGGYAPPRLGAAPASPGFNNPSLPGAFNPNANAAANAAGAGGDPGALPNRQLRTDAQGPQMSVEEQMYNMEVQRAAALEQNSPIANLLPITSMTPPEAIQAMQGGGYQPQQPPTAPNTPTAPTTPANNGPGWGNPQYRGTLVPTGR